MADFIYNNNYILSNMDAQKLYAQSPLTTGVSGTSAYIGIEPSAQYNETVLFSGECLIPSANLILSEPASAFEHVVFYYTNNDGFQNSVDFIPNSTTYGPVLNTITQWSNGNTYFKTVTTRTPDTQTYSAWTSGSQIIINSSGQITYGFNASNLIKIQKVVGINRKENV